MLAAARGDGCPPMRQRNAESALMRRGQRGRGGERERARRRSRVARQASPIAAFTAERPRVPPRRDPQAGDCAHRAHRHPGPAAQRADGGRSALTRCPLHRSADAGRDAHRVPPRDRRLPGVCADPAQAGSRVSPSRACGTPALHSRRPASATSPSSAACRNERRRPHEHSGRQTASCASRRTSRTPSAPESAH